MLLLLIALTTATEITLFVKERECLGTYLDLDQHYRMSTKALTKQQYILQCFWVAGNQTEDIFNVVRSDDQSMMEFQYRGSANKATEHYFCISSNSTMIQFSLITGCQTGNCQGIASLEQQQGLKKQMDEMEKRLEEMEKITERLDQENKKLQQLERQSYFGLIKRGFLAAASVLIVKYGLSAAYRRMTKIRQLE